jgi:hypothetical protein
VHETELEWLACVEVNAPRRGLTADVRERLNARPDAAWLAALDVARARAGLPPVPRYEVEF